MKQVVQRLRDGRIDVREVPAPSAGPEGVLVKLEASLLSAGTERAKVETGQKSLVGKARSRPDQVRQVVEKARRDGLRETIDVVKARLDQPSELGYSAAGIAQAVGGRVRDIVPGDRVACGGGGYAVHAELDVVPGQLCVPVPDGVSLEDAAFATVGSIAMHGVRQADARLGERVAVIGLGLVGQLAGRILRAAGCRVMGVDLSEALVAHALEHAAVDVAYARSALDPRRLPADVGECDAVVITAATSASDPVELAAALCRDRGRVVVVGDVGMDIPRAPFYDKELELVLSRSYGPGRYDREYEERGLDYPIGYVRWTERRNMAAFLQLAAEGRIALGDLITDRVPIEEAPAAYERLVAAKPSPLGIVLTYGRDDMSPAELDAGERVASVPRPAAAKAAGVIGAGSFAQRVLIPGLRDAGFPLVAVASATGLSADGAAERFGTRSTSPDDVLADPEVGLVVVATRHGSHAELATAALDSGRHVFVEKPPALDEQELARLRQARAASGRTLAVGFNRRHAPLALALRDHVRATSAPIQLLYRVSAGPLAEDHWLNDLTEGGGRLVGEGCHFVDFACWVAGALPARVTATAHADADQPLAAAQRFAVTLDFADGSLATVLYQDGGASRLPKERIEASAGARSAVLDDFRSLELLDGTARRSSRSRGQDKGHRAQLVALAKAIDGGEAPGVLDPLATMAVTLAALRSAELGEVVALPAPAS